MHSRLDLLEHILQIAMAAIAIIGFVWAAVVRPVRHLVHRLDDRLDQVQENAENIAAIRSEIEPNGGLSLKDSVNRIESGLNEVKGRMDAHIDFHMQERRERD